MARATTSRPVAKARTRRQHPASPYILVFYAPAAKLGIEIDGVAHDMDDRPAHDASRDAWLLAQGITLLRIPATDVLKDPATKADAIIAYVREQL